MSFNLHMILETNGEKFRKIMEEKICFKLKIIDIYGYLLCHLFLLTALCPLWMSHLRLRRGSVLLLVARYAVIESGFEHRSV